MRPNWFDRWIYRLFFWRWNRILASRPDIREIFIGHIKSFDVLDDNDPIKVTVTFEKR